jgi:diguanylate cyclase (GGDEF)-like protein
VTILAALIAARSGVLVVSNRELAAMSATDPLTGVRNRRSFFDHLRLEAARIERAGGELAVLLLDLDEFRAVNETRGHLAGDQSLRLVSDVLGDAIRGFIDVPCRIGGDEFGVILPSAGTSEAMIVAERIVALLAQRQAGSESAVTLSGGIAVYPSQASSVDELLERADTALYCAKHHGRDRVEVYNPAPDGCCAQALHARAQLAPIPVEAIAQIAGSAT